MDKAAFTTKIDEYFTALGKEATPGGVKLWYRALNGRMSLEELDRAIVHCLRTHDFPSVKRIIEAVYGTVEDRAYRELDLYRSEEYDRVSPAGKKAMQSLGGTWAFSRSQHPDRFRSDFVREFERREIELEREIGNLPQLAQRAYAASSTLAEVQS